jgi:hypothetical protein
VVRRLSWVVLLAACKAQLGDLGDASQNQVQDVRASDDTPQNIDAPVMLGNWGTPAPIPGASDATLIEDDLTLDANQTELYFAIVDPAITGNPKDLYVMTRATPQDAWGPKQKLVQLDTTANEESPRLSPDGLTLYFGRAGDILMTTRAAPGQPWGAPTLVPGVNTTAYEKWLAVCGGGYFVVSRDSGANNQDLYEGTLGNGPGALATNLSNAQSEISTFLSADCLTLYFSRAGDIYLAKRATNADPWPTPALLGPPVGDTLTNEEDAWQSADQRTLVFASNKAGTKDLYISTR